LIVSNVPGPDFPIYFSGAKLVAGFPLGPVLEGAGINITVMSYRGVLNWGLIACRETVAGLWDIADAIPAALDELLEAAGLPTGTPVGVAPKHVEGGTAKEESSVPHEDRGEGRVKVKASKKTAKKTTKAPKAPKAPKESPEQFAPVAEAVVETAVGSAQPDRPVPPFQPIRALQSTEPEPATDPIATEIGTIPTELAHVSESGSSNGNGSGSVSTA
jgi:hypothetical protein